MILLKVVTVLLVIIAITKFAHTYYYGAKATGRKVPFLAALYLKSMDLVFDTISLKIFK